MTTRQHRGRAITAAQRRIARAAAWLRGTADRGDAVLETAIMTPFLLLLIGLMIVGGHVVYARQKVQHAAEEGARAASIARPAVTAAGPAASAAATRDMVAHGLVCTGKQINTDVSTVKLDPGYPAFARVTITCEIELSFLGIPRIAGHRTITQTAVSAVDTYRERAR